MHLGKLRVGCTVPQSADPAIDITFYLCFCALKHISRAQFTLLGLLHLAALNLHMAWGPIHNLSPWHIEYCIR
jgi:hypothetical protein